MSRLLEHTLVCIADRFGRHPALLISRTGECTLNECMSYMRTEEANAIISRAIQVAAARVYLTPDAMTGPVAHIQGLSYSDACALLRAFGFDPNAVAVDRPGPAV